MKIKNIIIIVLSLLLLSIPVLAEDYLSPEYETTVRTIIGTGDESISTSFRGADNEPIGTPLVGDLDGDGTQEIIMIDGDNVEIYQESTLTIISGANAEDNIHHGILHDIDDDGILEIVTVGGDKISTFDFNGTSLTLTYNQTIPSILSSELEVGCDNTYCIIVNARYAAGVPSSESIMAHLYDGTDIVQNYTLRTAINNADWLLPQIREVTVADTDLNGRNEFIFIGMETGLTKRPYIYRIEANETEMILVDEIDTGRQAVGEQLANPIVYDFDPTTSGLEMVWAYQGSTDEFHMEMWSAAGGFIDDYPETDDTDGTLISNIIRTNAFTDTGKVDFCSMGYEAAANTIYLVCASEQTSDLIETNEFEYEGTVYYDLPDYSRTANTPNYRTSIPHIQAIDSSQTTTDGTNLDEILTPFGIFSIDFVGDNELLNTYDITQSDGAAIMVDAGNVDRADILYLSTDGLYYIDDGFVNSQAEISEHTINTGNPICSGVTARLEITVIDADDDLITCWMNETQVNGTVIDTFTNQSLNTGETISFYYTADSVGNYLLNMYCTDSKHTTLESETRDIYVVNSSSNETCNNYGENPSTTNPILTEQDAQTAIINEAIDGFLGSYNLNSVGAKLLLGLILACGVGFAFWRETKDRNLAVLGGMIGLIVGIAFGFVEIWVLIVLVLCLIAFIVWRIMKGGK